MRPSVIRKAAAPPQPPPDRLGAVPAQHAFDWSDARRALGHRPGGSFNMGRVVVDRHLGTAIESRTALRFVGGTSPPRELSYGDLARLSNRFANALRALGVGKGDRLFLLAGRVPELYVAALGALKNGTVVSPLFAAFGPEPIRARLALGAGRVLVTTAALYRRKVAGIRRDLPALEHVLLIGEDGAATDLPGTSSFDARVAAAAADFEAAATEPDDPALLHFTSGTTGAPKGAIHAHEAVLAHYASARYALDLRPDDVFWCTADPGWVTGMSYGIVAPLALGVTSVVDEGDFEAERWYEMLERERVSVWYTAPTAIRMLMKAGADVARRHRFPALRFIAAVGEPLNPEAVWWGVDTLGLPIHDNWWQTETGAIMIANVAALDIKPGSMGRPLPGIDARIVQRRADGGCDEVDDPERTGELALRAGWPSMFRGYLGEAARYRQCFAGDWYLSGDLARRDADGYFWFVGRADDVIKSAGHLIGPFEVESVLMEHPAVAEAGVIGKPDPLAGETVKAFVTLKAGCAPGEPLRLELLAHARRRLGAAVAPREIAFAALLPRTRSGKILRRVLRARELGLPEGDTSTLEPDA